MPIYEIEQHELCTVTYRIDAADAAAAIQKLDANLDVLRDAAVQAGSVEYHGVDVERGLSADEHPELARQLRERGIARIDDVIPGIADIREITTEPMKRPPALHLESEPHGREHFDHCETRDEILAAVNRLVEESIHQFAVDGIARTVGVAIIPASQSEDTDDAPDHHAPGGMPLPVRRGDPAR